MKKIKDFLLLLLIFILALSAFACSSGVNVDDFSVASKSDSVESSQGGEGGTGSIVTPSKDKTYAITVGTFEHGSVTVEGGVKSAKKGEQVVFIVTADSGYELAWIKVNDGNDLKSQIVSGKLTVTMYEMDVKVTALFSETGKINNSSYGPVKDDNAKENDLFSAIRETTQNGQFTLSAYNEIRYGDTVNITATPSDGYKVKEVVVTTRENNATTVKVHGNHNDWAFVMPKANVNVKVTFEKELYEITVAEVDGVQITLSKTSAYYGDEISVTDVSVDEGYTLLRIEANGVVVTDDKFTMPAGNVTLKAFVEKRKYTITVGTHAHGQVTIEGGLEHEFGETVVISLTPDDNYQLNGIEVVTDGAQTVPLNDLTFVMPSENVTITVEFEKINYTVTVNETTNGTASVGDKTTATYGETVTITVSPAEEYVLGGISINDGAVDCKKVSDTTYEFSMPAQSVTIVVTFSQEPHTITLSVGEGGTVTIVDDKKTATYGEEVALIITPETGYQFKKVTGVTLDANNKFTMPASDVTVTVEFELVQYDLSISVSGGNGTASIENNKTSATYGETVTVIATPENGYVLDTITVNGSAISGTSFSMPAGSVEIVVTFKNASVTVSTGTCTNGSVSATPSGTVQYGTTITLTATPSTGYELDYFTANGEKIVGGGSTYTVTSNVEFKAVFKAKSYTLTVQHKCGSTVLQTETLAMTFGTSTTVNAKTIEGYTATSSSISVTMDTEGKTVTLSYTKNNYTLTVQHIIQGDGSAFASTQIYTVAYGESKTVNPVSLTAYNGLIKASEGSKTVTMGASSQTVTYAYSLDTTKKFSSGSSTGAIPVITAKTGFSVTYKITDDTAYNINDWCKIFSIKNANIFAGVLEWFDDSGNFVDNWFDGEHGHGNNLNANGPTYNWNAVIKESSVYTVSFNTDGSIDWYRNGLRVLYFDANTTHNSKAISEFVTFLIGGAKSSGINFKDGAKTNSGSVVNKTNVSDCYIGYAIDKKTVTVSYSFSGTSDVSRGNSVYYMAPGFEYTFNTAMSGYSASRSTVVTGTGTSAESYSVTYTRSATTSTSILSTPVLVARKNAYHADGVFDDLVRVNGLTGDFFLQAKLTDVYQLQSGTDWWRVFLTGIYNGSNVRCYRFDRYSWNAVGTYGEWTQGNLGISSSDFVSATQGRSDILVTVSRSGNTMVICYKIYSYATSKTYYSDFLTESVTGEISFAFGGEDCTYTLEYINMENATGSIVVNTAKLGTTVYNKDWASGGWTDGRVRTTIRTGLTGNFNATINLYQLTYSSGYTYTDARWRTAILAIYGWCDYANVTVLRQDGHWWCDGGGDTGNSTTVTSSDTSLFTGNGTNTTGTKFADITRNAYIQITVAGTNVGTSSGKIVVTYYINSLNPDYKNTQYWLKYEISGVTRSHYDGYNTASVDIVMLCELASYVVYSYSVS